MNVLIGIVVAVFIITGAYVGYHVSEQQQQQVEETKGHDITVEPSVLGEGSGLTQISQDSKPDTMLSLYNFRSNLYY